MHPLAATIMVAMVVVAVVVVAADEAAVEAIVAVDNRVVEMAVDMEVMPHHRTVPAPGHHLPLQGHQACGLRRKGSHRDRRR